MKLALRKTAATGANWLARFAAWAIKTRLVSEYCHGGIVIGDKIYHATAQHGLCSADFTPEHWDLFEVNFNEQLALDLYYKHCGAGYDWFSLLAFVLPGTYTDSQRFYCFEWCWLCLTGEYPSGRVTPEMLIKYRDGYGA